MTSRRSISDLNDPFNAIYGDIGGSEELNQALTIKAWFPSIFIGMIFLVFSLFCFF